MADTLHLCPKSTIDARPEPNPDRLSELPDDLLLQIMSRLPFSEIVRTVALSSRWKNVWKDVDQITIDGELNWKGVKGEDELRSSPDFVDSLHRTLTRSACFDLNNFSLTIHGYFDGQAQDKLIQWAVSRNVKDFTWVCSKITFYDRGYRAPQGFCHTSYLENLFIKGHIHIEILSPDVCWSSLKYLHLSGVSIRNADMAKVMSGCPVLETLVLQDVMIISELNIVSPSVKTLRIVRESDDPFHCSVNAPWIENLECVGTAHCCYLRLKDVSCLRKANLNLTHSPPWTYGYDYRFYRPLYLALPLLERLVGVEDLVLGNYFTVGSDRWPLLSCKHLTFHLLSSQGDQFSMTKHIFQGLRCVETLVINVEHDMKEDKFRGYTEDNNDVDFGEYTEDNSNVDNEYVDRGYHLNRPAVKFLCLKYVKISHTFHYPSRGSPWRIMKCCFRVAAYIMKNADALKEVTIAFPSEHSGGAARTREVESRSILPLFEKCSHCFGEWFKDDYRWEIGIKMWSFEIICTNICN